MLDEFAEAEGPLVEVLWSAAQDADGIGGILREGVPGDVGPHLGEEDVDAAALGPIEDKIKDLHLGVVPGELALGGLVDALLEFDAAPVHAQPLGVAEKVVPVAAIGGVGIAPHSLPDQELPPPGFLLGSSLPMTWKEAPMPPFMVRTGSAAAMPILTGTGL